MSFDSSDTLHWRFCSVSRYNTYAPQRPLKWLRKRFRESLRCAETETFKIHQRYKYSALYHMPDLIQNVVLVFILHIYCSNLIIFA